MRWTITLLTIWFLGSSSQAQELIPYRVDSLWGFSDVEGVIQIPAVYDTVNFFSEGLAVVQKGGKYGYIDKNDSLVIDMVYDAAGSFSGKRAFVRYEGKRFAINRLGQSVSANMRCQGAIGISSYFYTSRNCYCQFEVPIYVEFLNSEGDYSKRQVTTYYFDAFEENHCGQAKAKLQGKWGMISSDGKVLCPFEYDAIHFPYSMTINPYCKAVVEKAGKKGVLSEKGEVIAPVKYSDLIITGNYWVLALMPDGLWAYVGSDGREYYSSQL